MAVGFSRAFFMEELKCVDKQHLAWLVMPLGTVTVLVAFGSLPVSTLKFA